jgi:glutamate-1-semialdehyde 2,1-aminomutase
MVNAAVIPPAPGYLERVRLACSRSGTVLIFDEVITGFRLGLSGAQGRFGVVPDLAVFAKAMGGGFPIACVAGRAAVMDFLGDPRVVRDVVRPMNGGTFNAFVPSVAASLATVAELRRPGVFPALEQMGSVLQRDLSDMLRGLGIEHTVQGYGGAFWLDLGTTAPRSHADVRALDRSRYRAFVPLLEEEGVRVHLRGVWYLSTAHSKADIDATVAAARRAVLRLPS